jgi:hypothetical protein
MLALPGRRYLVVEAQLRLLFNDDGQVHAVYPSISQEQLVKMTAEQIIARDASKTWDTSLDLGTC